MTKHLKYLKYVLRHKWYVFQECYKAGIPWRGLTHDLSKFLPSEWFPYTEYFYGAEKPSVYNFHGDCRNQLLIAGYKFKEDVEREFDVAWLHHQKRNLHHWQYWVLQKDDGSQQVLPMPDIYRKEMLCDWRGAGKAIKGFDDTRNWYLTNRNKMLLHPVTRKWVEDELGVD
jgi:hypothetical protein